MNNKNKQSQKGFTLLLAALVASITLSLGAAIYSITLKQVTLSGIGRDSQFAFYAADTLAECALFWDIHEGKFTTSSPPVAFSINCGGNPVTVTPVNNTNSVAPGNNSISTLGTTNGHTLAALGVPANYGTLTVTVFGAAGGGGGGATNQFVGGNAGAGSLTVFNGTVCGAASPCSSPGNPGGGGKTAGVGTTGTGGGALDGNVVPNGNVTGATGGGGAGGAGQAPGGAGGNGGAGGTAKSTYTPATFAFDTTFTTVVGSGGTGGLPAGGTAARGFDGTPGRIDFSWTGNTPQWSSTDFSFSTDLNNDCAAVTLRKALVSGSIRTTISSNGLNVPCASQAIDPRALQRSVQLKY